VTELELLRRRRELVVLSAELQRATVTRRLERIDASPARMAIGIATRVATIPLLWKVGSKALDVAMRAYRRRSVRSRHFAIFNR